MANNEKGEIRFCDACGKTAIMRVPYSSKSQTDFCEECLESHDLEAYKVYMEHKPEGYVLIPLTEG